MANQELLRYITQAREKNKSDSQIRTKLLSSGWMETEVQDAFTSFLVDDMPPAPLPIDASRQVPQTAPSVTAWDAFEHVLLFVSLYVFATAVALTLHYFVDKWVPGVPVDSYGSTSDWQTTLLRGYLAAIIVSLPLFCYLFVNITKRTLRIPAIRNLRARKFLIYLTLVCTFIIMLIDIITIVYNLLSGNVTLNFFLHFIVTIVVTGIIFGYYLDQVKEDRKLHA